MELLKSVYIEGRNAWNLILTFSEEINEDSYYLIIMMPEIAKLIQNRSYLFYNIDCPFQARLVIRKPRNTERSDQGNFPDIFLCSN